LLGQSVGDPHQIVAMLERQVRAVTVVTIAAEPLGKEGLLRLALVGEIAIEERPQRGVCDDPVVQPIDEGCERSAATNALEEIAADEGAVRLGVSQEPTVLHRALVHVAIAKSVSFSPRIVNRRSRGALGDDAGYCAGTGCAARVILANPWRSAWTNASSISTTVSPMVA